MNCVLVSSIMIHKRTKMNLQPHFINELSQAEKNEARLLVRGQAATHKESRE